MHRGFGEVGKHGNNVPGKKKTIKMLVSQKTWTAARNVRFKETKSNQLIQLVFN